MFTDRRHSVEIGGLLHLDPLPLGNEDVDPRPGRARLGDVRIARRPGDARAIEVDHKVPVRTQRGTVDGDEPVDVLG